MNQRRNELKVMIDALLDEKNMLIDSDAPSTEIDAIDCELASLLTQHEELESLMKEMF